MNDAIFSMMKRYDCKNSEDYENALKEIVQEVALMRLSRSNFFQRLHLHHHSYLREFQSEVSRLYSDERILGTDQKGIFCKFFLADPSNIAGLCFAACVLLSYPAGAVRKIGMQQWSPSNSDLTL